MSISANHDDERDLADGARVGRFVILRDIDGRRHATVVTGILALSDADDGDTLVHLPAGRILRVPYSLTTVLAWVEVR